MKKIQIIIIAVVGLLSLASTFTVTWFVQKARAEQRAIEEIANQPPGNETEGTAQGKVEPEIAAVNSGVLGKGMTEKQMQSMIYDLIEKRKEYLDKERELELQDARLKLQRDSLQDDLDQLNERVNQLNSILTSITQQEESLKNSIVEIQAIEKNNMKMLARRYDKMDMTQASGIIVNMLKNKQTDDAVKIIYYMSERTSGELVGLIGTSQPEYANAICSGLKLIKESE